MIIVSIVSIVVFLVGMLVGFVAGVYLCAPRFRW